MEEEPEGGNVFWDSFKMVLSLPLVSSLSLLTPSNHTYSTCKVY
jgi:hypothetical protein